MSLFIVSDKRVPFWVGILDLMLTLLTRQEQTLTDIDTDVSFLGLSVSILSTIHAHTHHIAETVLRCISYTFCFHLYWQSTGCPMKYKPCWLSSLSS